MAVNKETARIILNSVYHGGIHYDELTALYNFRILRVTEQMFSDMQNSALAIGHKITADDVNSFIEGVIHPRFIEDQYWYSLPLRLICPGEVFRITFDYGDAERSLEIMSMTDNEFLIIRSTVAELPQGDHMILLEGLDLASGAEVYITKIGNVKIRKTSKIIPPYVFNQLDSYFLREAYKYEVAKNIWYVYRDLRNFLSSDMSTERFDDLLRRFAEKGLSVFVLRKMLDALTLHSAS